MPDVVVNSNKDNDRSVCRYSYSILLPYLALPFINDRSFYFYTHSHHTTAEPIKLTRTAFIIASRCSYSVPEVQSAQVFLLVPVKPTTADRPTVANENNETNKRNPFPVLARRIHRNGIAHTESGQVSFCGRPIMYSSVFVVQYEYLCIELS